MNLSSAVVKGAPEITAPKPQQALCRIADCLYRSNVSGIIYAIVTHGGRQIRRSLKTRNKDKARVRLAKLRADLLEADTHRHDAELARQSFEDAAGCWLQSVSAALRPRTIARRQASIKALAVHFPQPIGRITRADVDKWSARRSQETAPATYCKELEALRLILAFAVERGAMPRSPAAHLKRRRIPKPHVTVPTREQFRLLLAELRRTYRHRGAGDLVEFLAASGCRLGEAVALRWRDVDWHRNTLTIGADGETKNGEHRVVPLFPPLRDFLERLRARHTDAPLDTLILPTKSAKAALTNACRRLGMSHCHHHTLRHLFTTNAIEAGIPPHIVAGWLGHRDGGQLVCRTYGHIRAEASELFAQRVTWDAPANVVAMPQTVNQ